MNTSNQTIRIALITGMMVLAAFTRLIPHPANCTAIMAVALFGGAKFRNAALAILVPLGVMLLTDLSYSTIRYGGTDVTLGLHSLVPLVYGCIAVTSLIGIYISKRSTAGYIIGASLVSSTLFFFVTNAGVWFHNPQFTQDASGLITCYNLGIPFYRNQLFGDLFFNGALFGIYALAQKKLPVLSVKA